MRRAFTLLAGTLCVIGVGLVGLPTADRATPAETWSLPHYQETIVREAICCAWDELEPDLDSDARFPAMVVLLHYKYSLLDPSFIQAGQLSSGGMQTTHDEARPHPIFLTWTELVWDEGWDNTICIEKTSWKGAGANHWCYDDPVFSKMALIAALIHEAEHVVFDNHTGIHPADADGFMPTDEDLCSRLESERARTMNEIQTLTDLIGEFPDLENPQGPTEEAFVERYATLKRFLKDVNQGIEEK